MNIPPIPMISSTTATLMPTITALTRADSWMPITSRTVAASEMRMAGRLMMAVAAVPSASTTAIPGALLKCGGMWMPTSARKLTT